MPFALADADTSLWWLGAVLFVRGLGLGAVMIPIMSVGRSCVWTKRVSGSFSDSELPSRTW